MHEPYEVLPNNVPFSSSHTTLLLFLKETTVSVIVCVPLRSLFSNFYQFKLILTFLLAPV